MPASFKPWLPFADQVALLEQRGMEIQDKAQAESDLERIGYYRLSGYFYPFRQHAHNQRSNNFVQGAQFQHVIDLYSFDNQIKLLALEAIQHIEIAMRVQISYTLGQHHPCAHLEQDFFEDDLDGWLSKYHGMVQRNLDTDKKTLKNNSSTGFVLHHKQKYGGLPVWAACELWDFGALSKLFQSLKPNYQAPIAQKFNLSSKQLTSYLRVFNFVRNVAAHHGRLWNCNIINRPTLAGFQAPQWKQLNDKEVFAIFCLMQWMLKTICPNNDWGQRFQVALSLFPKTNVVPNNEVSLLRFGIPKNLDLSKWKLWR